MVIELTRTINYFTGNFHQPIKLEILATGAAVDVDSLTVIVFMRKGGFIYSTPAFKHLEHVRL